MQVADALADIQYVLSGCILEFGMADKFKALFDEVHRSNMSKACKTVEEAEATVEYYTSQRDTPCHYKQVEGLYMVCGLCHLSPALGILGMNACNV